jgi:hypothetical protein
VGGKGGVAHSQSEFNQVNGLRECAGGGYKLGGRRQKSGWERARERGNSGGGAAGGGGGRTSGGRRGEGEGPGDGSGGRSRSGCVPRHFLGSSKQSKGRPKGGGGRAGAARAGGSGGLIIVLWAEGQTHRRGCCAEERGGVSGRLFLLPLPASCRVWRGVADTKPRAGRNARVTDLGSFAPSLANEREQLRGWPAGGLCGRRGRPPGRALSSCSGGGGGGRGSRCRPRPSRTSARNRQDRSRDVVSDNQQVTR